MNPLIGSVLLEIVDLFKNRRAVKEYVLPLVELAEQGKLDNTARRAFVLDRLMKEGFTEAESRLMLERGLKVYRRIQKRAAKRLARLARKAEREG